MPSATARAGAVVPILLGMVAAFGLAKNSRLAASTRYYSNTSRFDLEHRD